jgi:hypothetical protein
MARSTKSRLQNLRIIDLANSATFAQFTAVLVSINSIHKSKSLKCKFLLSSETMSHHCFNERIITGSLCPEALSLAITTDYNQSPVGKVPISAGNVNPLLVPEMSRWLWYDAAALEARFCTWAAQYRFNI